MIPMAHRQMQRHQRSRLKIKGGNQLFSIIVFTSDSGHVHALWFGVDCLAPMGQLTGLCTCLIGQNILRVYPMARDLEKLGEFVSLVLGRFKTHWAIKSDIRESMANAMTECRGVGAPSEDLFPSIPGPGYAIRGPILELVSPKIHPQVYWISEFEFKNRVDTIGASGPRRSKEAGRCFCIMFGESVMENGQFIVDLLFDSLVSSQREGTLKFKRRLTCISTPTHYTLYTTTTIIDLFHRILKTKPS